MDLESAAIDIILPVLEASVIYASYYCKACGRSTVTATDLEYGMKHAAMTTVGKHLGSHFPEDEGDSDESLDEELCSSDEGSSDEGNSDSSLEIVDDTDEPFTRYNGTEELYVKMNESFDSWETWEPQSPAEQAIKNAVDKQKTYGRVHPE